jgi:hypothetical protein
MSADIWTEAAQFLEGIHKWDFSLQCTRRKPEISIMKLRRVLPCEIVVERDLGKTIRGVGLVGGDGGGRGQLLPRPQGGVDQVGQQEYHAPERQPACQQKKLLLWRDLHRKSSNEF